MARRVNPSLLTAFLTIMAAALLLFWNVKAIAHGSQTAAPMLAAIMIRDSLLPRFVLSLIAGAALGLSGALFQQILRNPLAEPGTLAVLSGAKAFLFAATLWVPGLLALGAGPTIWVGGMTALLVVLLVSSRSHFMPLKLIVVGLMVSLGLEAFSAALFLVHFEELSDLLSWQTGSLVQNNWHSVLLLLPAFGLASVLSLVLLRPIRMQDIGEAGARSAGVPVFALRLISLTIAASLSAAVVATSGIIGFVGLAGPAIAARSGARSFPKRLLFGSLMAGGLLCIVDQGALLLSAGLDIPAGALTALLGSPFLIWLVHRTSTREGSAPPPVDATAAIGFEPRAAIWLPAIVILLILAFALAISVGRLPDGWHIATYREITQLIDWRLPRIVAAGAGGALLAISGCILQRLTGNSLASPEVIGVSSGGSLVVMLSVFAFPMLTRDAVMALSATGAFLMLSLTLWLGRKSGFRPDRMLLTGVALGALSGSLASLLAVFGDMRTQRLLGWLAGSTYSVTGRDAWLVLALALVTLCLLPLFARWLLIMPLGSDVARSVGMSMRRSRLILTSVTAIATGAATIVVGPLSFAGLAAPHIARLSGLRSPLLHIYGAALIGGLIMILADWIGRNIAFPWQIPAGIVATLLGSIYFLIASVRR